jgi:transcription termination factor NusA
MLEAHGITTIDELADQSIDRLAAIEGLDEEAADGLLATAQVTRDELRKMIEKTIAEELEREAAEERPLFDEDALADAAEPHEEAAEDEEAPAGDIFANFPGGDEDEEADEEPKKVDPFGDGGSDA